MPGESSQGIYDYIRTKKRRGNIKQLFLACNSKGIARPAHKNTISSWTKYTIAEAYQTTPDNAISLLHRATHEIRALASSLCMFQNVRIEDILNQCRWSWRSMFTSHYMWDLSRTTDGLFLLAPLMAAGEVVTPRQ